MRVVASAEKHGIPAGDSLHAWRNRMLTISDAGDHGLEMAVGPAPDGALLEVGAVLDDDPRSIHSDTCRKSYLLLIPKGW